MNPLVIMGDGPYAQSEFTEASRAMVEHDAMAINRAVTRPVPFNHMVTLYAHHVAGWLKERAMNESAQPVEQVHAPHEGLGVTNVWRKGETTYTHGTSSMFGLLVALKLGYTDIVLAGVPLLNSFGMRVYGNAVYQAWDDLRYDMTFSGANGIRVRSMGGYTQAIFGGL